MGTAPLVTIAGTGVGSAPPPLRVWGIAVATVSPRLNVRGRFVRRKVAGCLLPYPALFLELPASSRATVGAVKNKAT